MAMEEPPEGDSQSSDLDCVRISQGVYHLDLISLKNFEKRPTEPVPPGAESPPDAQISALIDALNNIEKLEKDFKEKLGKRCGNISTLSASQNCLLILKRPLPIRLRR